MSANETEKFTADDFIIELERISGKDKLKFAKWILSVVAILFVFGSISLLGGGKYGEIVFDSCKSILPPIATLIIGYYFSERSNTE
jgi:hypothetical protein